MLRNKRFCLIKIVAPFKGKSRQVGKGVTIPLPDFIGASPFKKGEQKLNPLHWGFFKNNLKSVTEKVKLKLDLYNM